MSSFPWLTVAGAIPLAGAVVVAAVPGTTTAGAAARSARDNLVKRLALAFSLAALGVMIAMALRFSPNGPDFQFNQSVRWIPQFGVRYAVGVDGIALVLILMTVVLMPVVILASWNDAEGVGQPGRRAAAAAQREDLLRAAARARDHDDRRLRGHRRLPVLCLLRGHAGPDVLHDRQLRRRPAAVRGGQVPALQPARRAADAGRGDRAVRLLDPRRASRHVRFQRAHPPRASAR